MDVSWERHIDDHVATAAATGAALGSDLAGLHISGMEFRTLATTGSEGATCTAPAWLLPEHRLAATAFHQRYAGSLYVRLAIDNSYRQHICNVLSL